MDRSPSHSISELGWRLYDSVNMAEEGRTGSGVAPATGSFDAGGAPQSVLEIPGCKVETVVVYLDRAEICRSLKTKIQSGENEILLKKLSSCVDKDSIRVESRGGSVTITEVAFITKHLSPEEESDHGAKEKDLRERLEEAKRRRTILWAKKHRLKKQRDVLDGFADNVMNSGSQSENNKEKAFLDTNVLQGMAGFFTLYEDQASKLDESLQTLELELEEISAAIQAHESNLVKLGTIKEDREARELSILLETTEETSVELFVSYVVNKAKWSPKYDIRVFSNDNTMKILYYGMVQQATGEDWEDARLCLSTAMPSVGGTVPDLGTQRLGFKPKLGDEDLVVRRRPSAFGRRSKKVGRSWSFNVADTRAGYPRFDSERLVETAEGTAKDGLSLKDNTSMDAEPLTELPPEVPPIEAPNGPGSRVYTVKESITSTMYEISRRSTIPCDNNPHKVSVAIIDLKPTFEYESVPKRAAHAYLKAKVKNTSPYALLTGPTNIFLDNNFIAKAELKAVSPSEDFTCSLGVDPGVRVIYRPAHKFREASGLISKTASTTFKQTIEIKNTHTEAIKILVMDQLPISTEEKIKVILQEPVIKHPEKYDKTKPIRLNKQNNIEWDLEITPGETRELMLKYSIDFPAMEELESSVMHFTESTC